MAILVWIAFGLLIGLVAHLITLTRSSIVVHILVGIVGALGAGFLGYVTELYVSVDSIGALFTAVLGSTILTGIWLLIIDLRDDPWVDP